MPMSGIGMAILLAIVCGAAVLTASSVLLFSSSAISEAVANVPAMVLYVPPIAAAVLTSAAFLLGYLWNRQS